MIIILHKSQILFFKVEKILIGSLDSILSPSSSVKIQIMGGKLCLGRKGKSLLAIVVCQQTFCIQKFVDNTKQFVDFTSFLPIIWIFTEGKGDVIKSRLNS